MNRPKVIFFDINETLLDLEPLKTSIVNQLGGRVGLGTLWFTTMLQYSLVVSVSDKYFDFGLIGASTLQMIANTNGIELSIDDAKQAVSPILSLPPHPDVVEGLTLLKTNNYHLVTLTNSSNFSVKKQIENSKLSTYFSENISIEDFGRYKPDVDVYHWAARKMEVNNDECLLIAAHGWDVAGASWAGWNSAFIARKGQELFPLAPLPQFVKPDLVSLAKELIQLR